MILHKTEKVPYVFIHALHAEPLFGLVLRLVPEDVLFQVLATTELLRAIRTWKFYPYFPWA
jgi:hypothetical protein